MKNRSYWSAPFFSREKWSIMEGNSWQSNFQDERCVFAVCLFAVRRNGEFILKYAPKIFREG